MAEVSKHREQTVKRRKTGIPRLLEISGKYKWLLVLAVVFSLLSAVLQFAPFLAIYQIGRELFGNAATPAMIDYSYIRWWGLFALLLMIPELLLLYAGSLSSHIAAFRTLYYLRLELSRHLTRLPLGFLNRNSTGAIKKNLEISVEKIEKFIAHQIPDLVNAIVLPLAFFIIMLVLDWRLALAGFTPIGIAYYLQMNVFFNKNGKAIMKSYLDAMEDMNSEAIEYVRGMPAVKVFGLTVRNFLRFSSSIKAYRDLAICITDTYKNRYSAFLVVLTSMSAFITPVCILLLSHNPNSQSMALTILMFMIIGPGVAVPMLKLMWLGGALRQISEGVARIDDILDQKPIPEPSVPKLPAGYTVTFDNVCFSYDDKDTTTCNEVLRNVSFTAGAGQITALVGPSGSGKTTIASLIPRFWDATSGSIRIGGVDVREMGTESLMNTVSFVFQDVHMFYDTIEENIRMGNRDVGYDDVVTAARAASCHEFIENLPEGYRTKIGEGGTYLSGGEEQRVAIARAILKDAPILVLDEATAFADPDNEVKIQQGLASLIQGKTVMVIAHRLTTIRDADQIVVVDGGRIVETGTHGELLAGDGMYRRMWNAYIDADAWEFATEESSENELRQ